MVGNSNGEFITDENGRIVIDGLEPGTTVIARETKTLEGYVLDTTPKSIQIKAGEAQTLRFYNRAKGCLVIRKLDAETHKPLAGVEFELTYADGGYVDAANGHLSSKGLYTTDKNGEIRICGITGTIVAKEVRAKDGYLLDSTPQTVKVNPEDTQTLTFYNEPLGGLQIIKKDEETGDRLGGVQFEVRKMNGEIVGTYTTDRYGVKQTLVVDPIASQVVKHIFELAAEGLTPPAIARQLTEEKVLIPSAYTLQYHPEQCNRKAEYGCTSWNANTVREILRRQEYLGHTVLRKTIGTNFKTDERRFATDEERLVFEDTHEPIVDGELWEQAHRRLKHATRRIKEGTHQEECLLPGLVYCADCGSIITVSNPGRKPEKQYKTKEDDTMEKFITDERTGLCYELVGDYYLIAGEDEPEGRTIGIWGQRNLRYIRKHKVSLYAELLTTGKLNDYLADLNEQAEAMFSRLVKQLSEKEGVTEALKEENQMLWVQRMNNSRSAAMEIVANDLIYC